MILKGSQRAGGPNLAAHLMNARDNEHVHLHELRDFAADDLPGAFKEAEAISRGTRCRQFLFSLSLSPPEGARVSVEAFESAIDRAEERLGLVGQPRAIVFHEKEGRRHAHCVWSRIDALTMTARHMAFYKEKLCTLSRDLYRVHGWDMPRGLADRGARDPANFTLAEWQQAKREGVDPRWLKADLQECWTRSDNAQAFGQALQQRGLTLARGDKRSFVVVGHDGAVHSLPRALGLKTKEVKERLGSEERLPGVEEAKAALGARMGAAMRNHIDESRHRFAPRAAAMAAKTAAMTEAHRAARTDLATRHQAEWVRETKARAERLPNGLAALWHRLTGRTQQIRVRNDAEAQATAARQRDERQALIDAQLRARVRLQAETKTLRQMQAEQLKSLRREVGRYLEFSRGSGAEHGRPQEAALGLHLSR